MTRSSAAAIAPPRVRVVPLRLVPRPGARPGPRPGAAATPSPRASQIDPSVPVFGAPTTASVRDNFGFAKSEIEALQAGKLDVAGGTVTGPIIFAPGQIIDGGTFP